MQNPNETVSFFPARLYRRHNGYYYCHVTVPHHIRPIIRRVQIKQSLRTRNATVASQILGSVEQALLRFFDYNLDNKPKRRHSYHGDYVSEYLKFLADDVGFLAKEKANKTRSL